MLVEPFSTQDMEKSLGDTTVREITAFERLPDEIIAQILQLTTPDSFASLIILNRKWRMVSQQAHLYALQLSRCPSYSAAHHALPAPTDDDNLPQLRQLFAHEIKRNLFEAYLRPKETVIHLVSTSFSSSSAPGGEAFQFSLSPRSHYVLAHSSSRIHIIDVSRAKVEVKRELKILRRPASVAITDDASLLAILSTDLQVDLYDLTGEHPRHTRAVPLDYSPRTISLSPTGSVLAAAYDSGVEVSSLDATSITSEKRAVKCYAVDSLSFSRGGTQLLGTTTQSRNPSTVVLTAPYYNAGASLPEDSVSALWTTSILFPNGSRDCSHAVLLPSLVDDEAGWTFTYDRVFETFRAVRIDDLRNGKTYFTGPTADLESASKLLPSTLPAASQSGDLVAAGFQGSIWLYGIPEDLDAPPPFIHNLNGTAESEISTPSSDLGRRSSAPSLHNISKPRENSSRTPQWQLLSDRMRNTFVEGRKIASLDGVSALHWVDGSSLSLQGDRLVAVAPGVGGYAPTSEDDGTSPVDGGRISILDFSYGITNGSKSVITIEVGQNKPDVLEEEQRDLDAEVAIIRRRTVAQRRGNLSGTSHAAPSVAQSTRPEPFSVPDEREVGDPFEHPSSNPPRRASEQMTSIDPPEAGSVDEEQEALDAPYSHTSPRSGTTLRRAATAAAVNRRLHPRVVAQDHIEYRRADGREEHPHESDADNWVPPPPPYSRDPASTLPDHIQRSILADAATSLQRANTQRAQYHDIPTFNSGGLYRSRTFASVSSNETRRERNPFQRTLSDSTAMATGSVTIDDEASRPSTSPSSEVDDLYDVSPPGTPQPVTRPAPAHQIPRRPVGQSASNSTEADAIPSSAMRSTLQQPVSPIPQPMNETMDHRLHDWENATELGLVLSPNLDAISSPALHERVTIDHAVPPNDDRRLSLPSPSFEIIRDNRNRMLEPSPTSLPNDSVPHNTSRPPDRQNGPPKIWRRSDAAPSSISKVPSESKSEMLMPSEDQLARLSSRKGRPPERILADPSQSRSGSLGQSRVSVGSHVNGSPRRRSIQLAQHHIVPGQASRSSLPNASAGAYGPPLPHSPHSNTVHSSLHSSYSSSSSRHLSIGTPNSRDTSSSRPRPTMQRLDTIHSVTSNGEPTPYMVQKSMNLARHPSRAERSAAKNIKDAKRRGWRASMKKDKYGLEDGTSSAGWTDVSRESGPRGKPGGKCVVM